MSLGSSIHKYAGSRGVGGQAPHQFFFYSAKWINSLTILFKISKVFMKDVESNTILMRTKKFETGLQLNSNFENHDIELKKQFKMKKHLMKTRKEKSFITLCANQLIFFDSGVINDSSPSTWMPSLSTIVFPVENAYKVLKLIPYVYA